MHRSVSVVSVVSVLVLVLNGCGGAVEQPPSDCMEPCAGDPVSDFSDEQGGTTGRWRYVEDMRAANGAMYTDMTFGEIDGMTGWVGAGATPAGVVNCLENQDGAGCAGVLTSLVFYPGTSTDPAVQFIAPENMALTINGKVRVADNAPTGVTQRFIVSRNSRLDSIESRAHVTSVTPEDFSIAVEALAGDQITLALVGTGPPVAFDYHINYMVNGEGAFPARCQLGATFNGGALTDACRGGPLENLNDGIGPAGMSVTAPSVAPQYGDARVFSEGQYVRVSGGPMNYSGDFTMQFWAKLAEPQHFAGGTPFADWNVAVLGGMNMMFDETEGVSLCVFWTGGTTDPSCQFGARPLDGGWHFYRITRSMASGELQLCVDGQRVLSDPNPGTNDITSDEPPHMARNVVYNPAYFNGTLDDFRGFTSALPCPNQ